MSMPPAIANTFLFEMMKSKSKDVTLAAIYALGEGRCQAENITRELHRLSQSDDMEIKIVHPYIYRDFEDILTEEELKSRPELTEYNPKE